MGMSEYLAKLRALTGTGSDYAVAKLLGVSENAVNAYRKGERVPDPSVALLIAEKLKLPPLQVICDAEIARATDPAVRTKWVRLRKTFAQKTAAVVIALLAVATPQNGDARMLASMHGSGSGTRTNGSALELSTLQIMRHLVQRIIQRWRTPVAAPSPG